MTFRARKAGAELKARKQLEQKYDTEDELGTTTSIVEWMNVTLDGDHPKLENFTNPSGKGVSWRKLQFYLRNGVPLCRLINKLLEADGKDHIKFNPDNTSSAFVALENIEQFNNGVKRYGVPDEPVFNKNDLYEGVKGPFYNVINCLNLLGLHANSKGYTPKYNKSAETGSEDASTSDAKANDVGAAEAANGT